MRTLRALICNERGLTFEGIALALAMITVAAIAVTDFLDQAVGNPDVHKLAHIREGKDLLQAVRQFSKPAAAHAPRTSEADQAATGGVPPQSTIVLDPCTGQAK
jgi:hypothetical protein